MDEPLSNLDAKLRVQMRSEIIKLHESLNATTIYVTHDQTEAMTMASRIVVMKLGHVQQIGTPIEIYNKPANVFVASFIGSPAMNLMTAHYADGKITLSSGQVLTLPANCKAGMEAFYGNNDERDVTFGVRPEDIHQGDEEHVHKYGGEAVDIKVAVAELLGHEYYVHTDFGGIDLVAKIPLTNEIKIGDDIKILIDMSKIHLFDTESGKRIY